MRACSTRTATRSCSPRPTRPAWRTTRRTRSRSRTSSRTVCAGCTARPRSTRTARTSSTTSPSTTSRSSTRPSPTDVDVEGILKGIYRYAGAATDGEDTGPRRRSSPPVSRCRGRCEAQRMLAEEWGVGGRRLVGDLLERAAPRGGRGRASTTCCTPTEPRDAVRDAGADRRARARSWRCRTGCARCRTRSRAGCPATTVAGHRRLRLRGHPRARRGGTSTSTPSRSWSRC